MKMEMLDESQDEMSSDREEDINHNISSSSVTDEDLTEWEDDEGSETSEENQERSKKDSRQQYVPKFIKDLRLSRETLKTSEVVPMPDIHHSPVPELISLCDSKKSLSKTQKVQVQETLMELVDACHSKKSLKALQEKQIQIKKEVSRQDGKMFKCDKCDKEYVIRQSKRYHMKQCHVPVSCKLCTFQASDKKQLSYHVQRIHESNFRTFKCDFCLYAARKKIDLNRHIIQVHLCQKASNPKDPCLPYECRICTASFKIKRSLFNHKIQEHGYPKMLELLDSMGIKKPDKTRKRKTVKKVMCQLCKSNLKRKDLLYSHLKNFHKVGLSVKNKSEFNTEMDNNTFLSCSLCEAKFDLKSKLQKHERKVHQLDLPMSDIIVENDANDINSSEKKNSCLLCTYSYPATGNIAEKFGRPFLCSMCFMVLST